MSFAERSVALSDVAFLSMRLEQSTKNMMGRDHWPHEADKVVSSVYAAELTMAIHRAIKAGVLDEKVVQERVNALMEKEGEEE